MNNFYRNKPFLINAKAAHEERIVLYKDTGEVVLKIPSQDALIVSTSHQFSLIRPTFDDLNKALSTTSNSPLYTGEKTLRQLFDKEFAHYDDLVDKVLKEGKWEPDYGTYVFDYYTGNLYLIAPHFWHRLGLVTNNSKLLTDQGQKMSWRQIREVFDNAVIGFVGASVGGNILEGAMREIRPKRAKVADLDWIEITNLNRLERGSIQFLAASKASRSDIKDSFDITRINKAEVVAYQQNMVDPYAEWYTYQDGIHNDNIEQFLLGNKSEPKIDILVEESDDFRLKVELRKWCQKYKIPVLMLTDFGHLVQGQFQDFKKNPKLPLGYKLSDEALTGRLEKVMGSGERKDKFAFIEAMCGKEFNEDTFGVWVKGEGEQPTSSVPQSGATAMTSGGVGGKVIALYLLGYSIPERFIYDLKSFTVSLG